MSENSPGSLAFILHSITLGVCSAPSHPTSQQANSILWLHLSGATIILNNVSSGLISRDGEPTAPSAQPRLTPRAWAVFGGGQGGGIHHSDGEGRGAQQHSCGWLWRANAFGGSWDSWHDQAVMLRRNSPCPVAGDAEMPQVHSASSLSVGCF